MTCTTKTVKLELTLPLSRTDITTTPKMTSGTLNIEVKNVSFTLVAFQFLAALVLSSVAPIAVIAAIEQIRPLAIYGHPIAARAAVFASSTFGALAPFYFIRSPFTTTDVNATPANEHQEMLNWHVSQVGTLIAWVPVTALVAISARHDIGLLYTHGVWVLFGCLAFGHDWLLERSWFGNESKQGDGKNEEKAAAPIKTDDKLRNRKAGTADATSAEGEAAEVKKVEPPKKKRSNLPNWFPVFGAATVMPVVSTLHTINQLLMGIEPTIIDGTPALGVIGLVTLFASILVVSLLPYVLTAPNTIARTSQLSLFVLGLASLLLLNQLYEPLTIPSDVAPFDREHPLKIIPKMEMDVTDVNNPKTTYDLTFNTLALPYLVPTVLKPKSTKCSAVNKVTTKCSIDPIPNKIHGPRFPELAKALDVVEFQEIGKSTWSVTVRSEYSRICFFGGVEGDDNAWRLNEKGGIYPYNVWPGTNSVRPSKFDSRVGTAFAYKSYFDEPQTFTVKVNRTRIDELGASAKLLTMKVGCYVDDLAYIPGWDSLEKAVLPKWTVLEGSGNGVLTVSKKFVLIL
ncbi:hypothetical protein BCR33DRAFT_15366 [Rhizoclosmatium globosum]|uniref:Uncharacterized protein n=1 Tax=Rhizoclosmatium globosum TaxID=329046 RepID=A0A1Y2CPX6_9FUNG|nr:hypothetical protein BCR33DRAFT_15366 [Rhizoclosmatium globosum]|eukprot:ORY48976.1 hypothetical protein BCR33DRAFT_15366 [Rhizoclosmatium globosum]